MTNRDAEPRQRRRELIRYPDAEEVIIGLPIGVGEWKDHDGAAIGEVRSGLANGLGEPRGLRVGRDPEVPLERRDAVVVLAQHRGAVAAPRVQGHEEAMRRLVRGIEREVPPRRLDRLVDRAGVRSRPGCGAEPVTGQGLEPGALIGQPLLERLLSNAEPLEELAADDLRHVGGARLFQHGHIHVDERGIEIERVAIRGDDLAAQRLAQGCERSGGDCGGPARRPSRPRAIRRGDHASVGAPAEGRGKQQGRGLLRAYLEAAAGALRAEAAEQEQLQPPVTHGRLHPE